jgi:hypothetical protein
VKDSDNRNSPGDHKKGQNVFVKAKDPKAGLKNSKTFNQGVNKPQKSYKAARNSRNSTTGGLRINQGRRPLKSMGDEADSSSSEISQHQVSELQNGNSITNNASDTPSELHRLGGDLSKKAKNGRKMNGQKNGRETS